MEETVLYWFQWILKDPGKATSCYKTWQLSAVPNFKTAFEALLALAED